MKKATVCLTFDDGKENTLPLIYEKLIPLNIPATIFVITGRVDKSVENRGYPSMTKEKVIELYKTGLFEIANHGDSHQNTLDDIKRGNEKIRKWLSLPKEEKIGFASPGSNLKKKDVLAIEKSLKDVGVLYVRTYDNSLSFDEKEKDSHAFIKKDEYVFSSLVVYKGVTPKERLIELTSYAIKNGLTLVLMLHNFAKVGDEIYGGDWTYDIDEFSEYIDYLHSKRLEGALDILTVKDALEKLKK